MIGLRRKSGEALGELSGKEDEFVIDHAVFHQAFGVLLDLVQLCRPVHSGRGKAGLAGVGRIGQAADGSDVLRQSFPDGREPSAVVNVRGGELVA